MSRKNSATSERASEGPARTAAELWEGEKTMLQGTQPRDSTQATAPAAPAWSYEEAFCRNLGLISAGEQERLRRSRVAIIGMGGVGGIHLMTLARLGIGGFSVADPDHFELANFNRQYGASVETVGQGKARVMADAARAVNPSLEIKVFDEAISERNVGEFLEGVDVLVDGIDFFSIEVRRLVFREAARRGIWALTAGPIGFSTAWLVFDPTGMSFDRYFDLNDSMSRMDQLIAFAVGLAPRATHLAYMDLSKVNINAATGPSLALACHLCAGVAAAETAKIILGCQPVRPVPWYFQFDAHRQVLRKGRLHFGNRHPWQRFKRWWLRKRFG
ncbi:MAG: ThiF family adenylyltransferase [Pirellulales bacterium]